MTAVNDSIALSAVNVMLKEVTMPTFRFDLNEEYSEKLKKDAEAKHLSIQDYIRFKLFSVTSIFTVEEAIKRIQGGHFEGQFFSLPDIYGDDWTPERGPAGVFGKNFYNYVEEHSELGIHFENMGKYGRRATYTYKGVK